MGFILRRRSGQHQGRVWDPVYVVISYNEVPFWCVLELGTCPAEYFNDVTNSPVVSS